MIHEQEEKDDKQGETQCFSLLELCCKENEERLRPELNSLLCLKMESVLRSGSQPLSMEEEGEVLYPPMGVITKDG